MAFKVPRIETQGIRQWRSILLAVGVFYALSIIVYLATFANLLGIDQQYFVSQMVSIILLIPLFFWYRSKRGESSGPERSQTVAMVALGIMGLYLLAMSVRVPFVAFLKFPLEKTPLIYLVVLTLFLVERKPVSSYGFNLTKPKNQLGLGLFLLMWTDFLPILVGVPVFIALYGVNLLEGYSLLPVVLGVPFQVLAIGLSEEGFFRGYMQTKLNQVTGVRRALLLQAALFGIWHFVWHINPLDFVGMARHIAGAFVFGILTGTYFRYTRSIAGLSLFHGLSNSIEGGLNPNLPNLPVPQNVLLAIFAIVQVTVTVLLVVFSRKISQLLRVKIEKSPKLL